jgi:hypothetical protein
VRAHFTRPVTDEQGNLLPNAQVNIYDPATTTPIGQVLYSTDVGNNVLTNPYVSSTGQIDFYLDNPTRVRIGIVQGGLPMQFYEDVDVLAAGSDSPHTGAGTESLVIGVAATSVGDSSVALGPAASSGGASAVGVGPITNALGDYSAALGSGASTSGVGTTAVGRNAAATGDSSTALGNGAQTGDESAVALGDGATSIYAHASAIGSGAETTRVNQVMIGSATDIVEIAAGAPIVLTDADGVRWTLVVDTDGSLDTEPA